MIVAFWFAFQPQTSSKKDTITSIQEDIFSQKYTIILLAAPVYTFEAFLAILLDLPSQIL